MALYVLTIVGAICWLCTCYKIALKFNKSNIKIQNGLGQVTAVFINVHVGFIFYVHLFSLIAFIELQDTQFILNYLNDLINQNSSKKQMFSFCPVDTDNKIVTCIVSLNTSYKLYFM